MYSITMKGRQVRRNRANKYSGIIRQAPHLHLSYLELQTGACSPENKKNSLFIRTSLGCPVSVRFFFGGLLQLETFASLLQKRQNPNVFEAYLEM